MSGESEGQSASDKDLIWALKTGAIKNCEVKPKELENAIAIWARALRN